MTVVMHYRFIHTQTQKTTGYFSCEPVASLAWPEAFDYLEAAPLDSFFRKYLILRLGHLPVQEAIQLFTERNLFSGCCSHSVLALARDLCVVWAPFAQAFQEVKKDHQADSALVALAVSPFCFLNEKILSTQDVHLAWENLLQQNVWAHQAVNLSRQAEFNSLLKDMGQKERALQKKLSVFFSPDFSCSLSAMHAEFVPRPAVFSGDPGVSAEEIAGLALERLQSAGILSAQEMRHEASLSPVGLLRSWKLAVLVEQKRLRYSLKGEPTAYGRGLDLPGARVSCLMEIVERASLYVSVRHEEILGRKHSGELLRGSRSDLLACGKKVLNPCEFSVLAPDFNFPLHWLQGQDADGGEVYVPLQMAALFCNLDEVDFFESLGSTGAASGNTLEEAKLAALLEVIEREAAAVTPFCPGSCFSLSAGRNDVLQALLAAYELRGVRVHFQNLSGTLGVPVFKAFVMSRKGEVHSGYGAALNARKALLASLTEVPYPFPNSPPSAPYLRNLPEYCFDDFPDYTLGSPVADLALLENLLRVNQRLPIYVDMSREDLSFPVIRAFIPGFEVCPDSAAAMNNSWRLLHNFQRMLKTGEALSPWAATALPGYSACDAIIQQ